MCCGQRVCVGKVGGGRGDKVRSYDELCVHELISGYQLTTSNKQQTHNSYVRRGASCFVHVALPKLPLSGPLLPQPVCVCVCVCARAMADVIVDPGITYPTS